MKHARVGLHASRQAAGRKTDRQAGEKASQPAGGQAASLGETDARVRGGEGAEEERGAVIEQGD